MKESVPSQERRRFLNWFLGGSVTALFGAIIYPVLRFISPPRVPEAATDQIEAGAANDPELLEKGFKIVPFGSEPVIVIRAADGDFRAFSATCTHLDCIVEYHKDEQRIWCNCHNGEYDMNGRNIAGPPPKPLTAYSVHVATKGSGQPGTIVVARS
ncbi:MAG: Rieske 2Fe-2S domain-containing protein [Acidobacteriota bacterium]|nr:MAG: Rieske 2Fe-2S domain-containing protein [Acidobacteriota bacterium]